jgi:hypothetical protein
VYENGHFFKNARPLLKFFKVKVVKPKEGFYNFKNVYEIIEVSTLLNNFENVQHREKWVVNFLVDVFKDLFMFITIFRNTCC